MKLSVGILAGGKSSRMGQDKVLLKLKKKSFLDILINEFSDFDELIISLDYLNRYKELSCKKVEDSIKDIGPIEGIRQILKESKNKYNFICAADMPFLKKDIVEYISTFISSDFDCYIICDGERKHPLCAVYSKDILPIIDEMIEDKNYKLLQLVSRVRTKYINLKYTNFDKKVIQNINTYSEYKNAVKPLIFCISGIKNSGKTTLITKLINEFQNDFPKIAVIKHDGHDFIIDHEGTDTDKITKAGAMKTVIFSNKKYASICKGSFNMEEELNNMKDMDMIIVEGMKNSYYPKIEILREGISDKPICDHKTLIAVATDGKEIKNIEKGIPSVELNNVKAISQIILNYFFEGYSQNFD